MLSLPQLIALLQRSQLISPLHLNRLRRLAESAPDEFTPLVAVKWLIAQGQLTQAQAERLLVVDPKLVAELGKSADEPPLQLADWDMGGEDSPPAGGAASPGGTASSGGTPPATGSSTPPRVAPIPLVKPVKPAAPLPVDPPAIPVEPAPLVSRGPLDEFFDSASPASIPAAAPIPAAVTRKRAPGWDSPLLVLGGGALILLVVLGAFLVWALNRQSGEDVLAEAEREYAQGAYGQAIHRYDYFLSHFPQHARASFARVQRGTARLRQGVESGVDPRVTLDLARQVLAEISVESSFPEGRGELTSLLPTLAEQLTRRASDRPDVDTLSDAQAGLDMALMTQYVPLDQRPATRLQQIETTLRQAERRMERDRLLGSTVDRIRQEATAGKLASAYQSRNELLSKYPELRSDPALLAALATLTTAQRDAVVPREHWDQPLAGGLVDPAVRVVPLVHPVLERSGATGGNIVAALIDGVLWGLDSATGTPRWRHALGSNGAFRGQQPIVVGERVFVVHPNRWELWCCRLDTGGVLWRLPLADPVDQTPLAVGDALLLVTRAGTVVSVSAATGEVAWGVELGQPVAAPLAVDPRQRWAYVVGEWGNLFVLALAERTCREVHFLGHAPGSIVVPPALVGRYLLLAENRADERSVLRVWRTNAEGLGLEGVEELPQVGAIRTPLAVAGRTAYVVTDRGALTAYEVTTSEQGLPLKKLAELPPEAGASGMRYIVPHEGQVVVAGPAVTMYEMQLARGRLATLFQISTAGPATAPPQVVAGTLVTPYRHPSLPGGRLLGASLTGGKPLWEQQLNVPTLFIGPRGDDGQWLVTANGGLYSLAELSGTSTTTAAPVTTLDAPLPLAAAEQAGGVIVASLDSRVAPLKQQWVTFDLARRAHRWWNVNEERIVTPPRSFHGGWLLPLEVGQVQLVEAVQGRGLGDPFHPRLEVGVAYGWSTPLVDGDDVFLADGRSRLYRLQWQETPRPHLAAMAERVLAEPLGTRWGIVGETIWCVERGEKLIPYTRDDLTAGQEIPLEATLTWGPERVGDVLLLANDRDELWSLDGSGSVRWRAAWTDAETPVGSPWLLGGHVLLATRQGSILKIDLATGRTVERRVLGEPLSTGLGATGAGDDSTLVVGGRDGAVIFVSGLTP